MNAVLDFFLISNFSCQSTIYWTYWPMDSTETRERIANVSTNMKIQSLNIFFTEENEKEMREPVSCRREGKFERKMAHIGIPRSGQQTR